LRLRRFLMRCSTSSSSGVAWPNYSFKADASGAA
jgi:hypothetical protein